MTSAFYSDRTSGQRPRTGEEVTPEAWRGVLAIIKRRLGDGTLAKSFPIQDCIDGPFLITGTNTSDFEQLLVSLIPALKRQEDEEPGAGRAPVSRPTPVLDPNRPPPTPVALDVVDFVMQYVATPTTRTNDDYWKHEHLTFNEESENSGRAEFAREVELIFQRNGIGFTFGSDLQVVRLGPPEARELLSDFAPRTGDAALDSKLRDATTRFLSRDLQQRVDALEKLWDAFERFKTLELGGDKKRSARALIERAAGGPGAFAECLDQECGALREVGNRFYIRHFEHDKEPLPGPEAVDYLFTRLAALIAFLLRQTGRM